MWPKSRKRKKIRKEKYSLHPHSQSSVCFIDSSMHRPRLKVFFEEIIFIEWRHQAKCWSYGSEQDGGLVNMVVKHINCTSLCFLKFGPLTTCIRNSCSTYFKRIFLDPTLDQFNQIFFGYKWFETNQSWTILAINWKQT